MQSWWNPKNIRHIQTTSIIPPSWRVKHLENLVLARWIQSNREKPKTRLNPRYSLSSAQLRNALMVSQMEHFFSFTSNRIEHISINIYEETDTLNQRRGSYGYTHTALFVLFSQEYPIERCRLSQTRRHAHYAGTRISRLTWDLIADRNEPIPFDIWSTILSISWRYYREIVKWDSKVHVPVGTFVTCSTGEMNIPWSIQDFGCVYPWYPIASFMANSWNILIWAIGFWAGITEGSACHP